MHKYFIKTPWLVRKIFSRYIWKIDSKEKVVYLSFDDGPHPAITPWVLQQLKKYNALASFFCIGENVLRYPDVYKKIIEEGHAVGNHTQQHLNGWKVTAAEYCNDVQKAAQCIHTNLFRPPYGKIKWAQVKLLPKAMNTKNVKVIMWDVLSADFDQRMSPKVCLDNVLCNYGPGSIIVFHDSEKAFTNLQFVLPLVLAHLQRENYSCQRLEF